MNELELRLECLRLAASQINYIASLAVPPDDRKTAIELAADFYAFVKGSGSTGPRVVSATAGGAR